MDTISNMLIKMKNGSRAKHDSVTVPASKQKLAILECLKKAGFVKGVAKATDAGHPIFEIALAYDAEGNPKIKEVERLSKPSRRVYASVKEIKPVKNGTGLLVLSTPKGILTGRDARKEMVGGEVLFSIA